MHLSQIAKAIDGTLSGQDIAFSQLASDTRKLEQGTVFIALKGESFDAHDFIEQAIEKGAAAIIAEKSKVTKELPVPTLWVKDTTLALGKLAHFWRMQFDIPVIGITGSCGKTTVKSMLGEVLSLVGPTLVPEGSFNNQFGLPFTLLQLKPSHQFGILEIGTNGFGEIAYLTQMSSPTISTITNVNPAHLQGLKTLDNVAQEKGDIYKFLSPNGVAIINQDEPYADLWRNKLSGQPVMTFGLEQADVTAKNLTLKFGQSQFDLMIHGKAYPCQLQVSGNHNVKNALTVAAIATALKISPNIIVKGLSQFTGVKGRLKTHQTSEGVIVIDDSYNANPASLKAAIDVLSQASGDKVLVMGDMAELGDMSENFHREIGHYAKEKGVDRLYAVGQFSQNAIQPFGQGAQHFNDKKALLEALTPTLKPETTVLIKGSRSARMEEVLTALVS